MHGQLTSHTELIKRKGEPFDSYKAHRFSLNNATLTEAKAEVDSLVKEGGWLVFMTHCWDTQWQTASKQQNLRDLIDYIKSLAIDVVTVNEGLHIHGNIVGYGEVLLGRDYFKVDKQGTIHNKGNRFYSERNNSVFMTTPPSFFKLNAITITYHDSGTTATGFPETNIGTLITTKGLQDIVFQEWYPHYRSDTRKYIRRNSGNTAWTNFEVAGVNYVRDLAHNGLSPTDNSKFVPRTITKSIINSSHPSISSMPEGRQGTYTAGFYSENGFYTEEYDVRSKNTKYRRIKKDDGTFSDWLEYCFRKQIVYSKAFPTLAAGGTAQVKIDISAHGLTSATPIAINIGQPLPNGLMITPGHNGTELTLNLYNASGSSIAGATYSIYGSALVVIY